MAFIDDIQSRDTALFPVIEFEIPEGDILRVSIKPFTLEGNYYSPLLLSSPSIKESIDLENRKYKISTVTLSLSNVEVSGARFSDNKIPFNTGVSIYWVSPSCITLSDCYLAFKGSVRQISHDEKTCSITVEDISQSSLHKDVPVAIMGSDDNVTDKYLNKPMPMVYGNVNKSPAIIKVGVGQHMSLHTDVPDYNTKVNGEYNSGDIVNSPLYIHLEDRYATIPSSDEDIVNSFDFRNSRQYENSDGSETIDMKFPIAFHDDENDDSIPAPLIPASVGAIFVSYTDDYTFSDGDTENDFLIETLLGSDTLNYFERDYTYPEAVGDRPGYSDKILVNNPILYDYQIEEISGSSTVAYTIILSFNSGVDVRGDNVFVNPPQPSFGGTVSEDFNYVFFDGDEGRYSSSRIRIGLIQTTNDITGVLYFTMGYLRRTCRHLVDDISKQSFYVDTIGRAL